MKLAPNLYEWRHSLTFRLISLGVVMVLMGGLARYTVSSAMLKEGLIDTVGAQQLSLANYVAEDINGKVAARQKLLEQLAHEIPLTLLDRPQSLETWLESRHKLSPLFSLGLVVIPVDGKSATADYPPLGGRRSLDFDDRDWFIAARDGAQFSIGKPEISRVSYQAVVNMAMPVKNSKGKVVAVLMGETALSMPGFIDNIEAHKIGRTGSLLLFSPRDEIFLAATGSNLRLQPTPRPGVNRLHDKAMAGWRGSGVTVNAFGVENLAAFASVPNANWVVVARMPTDEVLSAATAMTQANIRSTAVSALLLVVLLIFILGRLFRPLKDSARQMREMADGRVPLGQLPVLRHDEVGEVVNSFNVLVKKLKTSEMQMEELAHNDALTGLPNRRSVMTRMPQMVSLAARQGGKLAVLFVDLDGFKQVNDSHGHKLGDISLQQVAKRLSEDVRQSDLVGRIGGDEFVLLLTDCQDQESVGTIAQKIILRLSQPYVAQGIEMRIGASIGIAIFPDHALDVDALMVIADAAMYEAKRRGGNGFHFLQSHP